MYIQIDNAGFINKGAELMLRAIIDRLGKEESLNPKFVAGQNCIASNNIELRKAGLYQIPQFYRFHYRLDKLLPQFALEPYGLAKRESVNVILDAGGFQFGDQWAKGYSKESNMALYNYYKSYKKRGCKIIFLPQAFGPFEHPLSKERMEIVYEHADLIYARDNTSYKYLHQLFGIQDKIKLAPDFTSLVVPDIPLKLYTKVKDGICLIPNARMIDKTDAEISKTYFDYLINIVDFVIERNEKLILLNHEGVTDWKLIQDIQNSFPNRDEQIIAINNLNAFDVKAVIGASKLVITSRFHGLVSGLNQQVPSLCTSWNHKYEELLADYGVPNNILSTTNKNHYLPKIENALQNPESFKPKSELISELKQKTQLMWNEVLGVMKK